MKLNTAKKSLESSGMNINVDFTIDMNGKAFNVLSDGMYSDVVTTIVRELSSNAYDAHVAAGKVDVPFEVGCPSAFDPHFYVKDFGTGLRYFKYNAKIVNEHEGESTIFIDGDVREDINGINLIVLNETETVRIGAILFDNSAKQTVIRIADDYEGDNIPVEFDDALVLYSTYFRSTKEQSNDYIGAFGLGSKTPFAYTDNFIVINRYNGVERVYNILTNQDSKPQINLMSSNATDEDNGLEVKLAVSPDDYSEFRDAIASQLVYFNPRPTICNDVVSFADISYWGDSFLILDGDLPETGGNYWNREARAVVGNNAYSIQHVSSDLFKKGNLALRFKVGEVMVTASREELKYDESTKENIALREKEAVAEYTKYVLDRIDDDGMTDYEKATFLNENCSVIDLSDSEVKRKVGNPHYRYSKNSILIPISGWGDYVSLSYKDETEIDANGNQVTTRVIDKYRSTHNHCLRWSAYQASKGKAESIVGSTQYIKPNENLLVFVKDNTYSFLKKIKFYMEENEVDSSNTTIMLLDYDSDAKRAMSGLKSLIGHTTTFVNLSEIEVPKNISYTPTDRCPTPVAREFDTGSDCFAQTKFWSDIYTPLTKIDTDAYIVKTHRCEIEDMDWNDKAFVEAFFRGKFPHDPDITILALSRARYEKALEYGFKPISELVTELKKSITVPVDLANYKKLSEDRRKLFHNRLIDLFDYFTDEEIAKINKTAPISRLLRIRKIIKTRYFNNDAKFSSMEDIINYLGDEYIPEPSKMVTETLDKIDEMCDNISRSMVLLDNMSSWEVQKETKKQALIDYINMLYPNNTGENDE